MSDRPTALFALDRRNLPLLFPPDVLSRLREQVRIDPSLVVEDFENVADSENVEETRGARDTREAHGAPDPETARAGVRLADVEFLITGWGCPPVTERALDRLPRLRAIAHTGGTVRGLLPEEVWRRGIDVVTAAAANALPVSEYTLGMILLLGKDVLTARESYRAGETAPGAGVRSAVGNVGRRVGIVGASRIGRRVVELLRPFDFDVVVHDPYLDQAGAAALGVRTLELEELLATSDIVSIHAPATPETHHLLDAGRLALMPDGAALINTARGSLVDTEALTRELVSGRLQAVLDVTDPEPLPAGSPLYRLPNVVLTPHVAGSLGNELRRMGLLVVDEIRRLRAGEPPLHRVAVADLRTMA